MSRGSRFGAEGRAEAAGLQFGADGGIPVHTRRRWRFRLLQLKPRKSREKARKRRGLHDANPRLFRAFSLLFRGFNCKGVPHDPMRCAGSRAKARRTAQRQETMIMYEPLRVAIIGTGNIAGRYAASLKTQPEKVTLLGAYDVDP